MSLVEDPTITLPEGSEGWLWLPWTCSGSARLHSAIGASSVADAENETNSGSPGNPRTRHGWGAPDDRGWRDGESGRTGGGREGRIDRHLCLRAMDGK